MTTIFWFRQDLRLSDNLGLIEASKLGNIIPIYIWSDVGSDQFNIGKASQLYLHHSLESLDKSLEHNLNFYKGDPQKILTDLIQKYNIKNVFCTRCYEPWHVANDAEIEKTLTELHVNFCMFNGSYLWQPENIKNEDGSYYKVFSAYKRKAYLFEPRKSLEKPKNLNLSKDASNPITLKDLNLISDRSWERKIESSWGFGENTALRKLDDFVNNGLLGYKIGRNYPARENISRLSVNLHFGEVSPHQIWDIVQNIDPLLFPKEDLDHFLSELIWREFSCYLMTHFKGLPSDNLQVKFNRFPWESNEVSLNAWQKGQTGYPIVDAGMRELWETGYMHNRVRMTVASFLVKNLMIHWHFGRDWFWNCLVDADLANNSASWQWVAGCGADSAPYFRIFNPITQGEKFDQDGAYTRKFVPELRLLPDKYLFKPWTAPQDVLKSSGVILGQNYPKPIVDLETSSNRALEAYNNL
jgi:deoxyribodipyrimidine photo-lyase